MMNNNPLDAKVLFGREVPAYQTPAKPTAELPGPVRPKRYKGDQANEVDNTFDRIARFPGSDESIYFPRLKTGKDEIEGNFITNLDWYQQVFLGHMISAKAKKPYKLLTLQQSYDLVHSNDAFKNTLSHLWIYDREMLTEGGQIFTDPIVIEAQSRLQLAAVSKRKSAEINRDDVVATLVNAGLFKEPEEKIWKENISFEKGEASVRSDWGTGEGFGASAGGPSGRSGTGVVAFIREVEE